MSIKVSFRNALNLAPIAGACASLIAMGIKLFGEWRASEAVVALLTLAATAAAGAASVYIARTAKNMSSHKRIFISYSREEAERAKRLREVLVKRGAYVWFDQNDLQPGDNLRAAIKSAIESSNSVVALLPAEIGKNIKMELHSAIAGNVPVIAVNAGTSHSFLDFPNDKKVVLLPSETDNEAIADKALGGSPA